MGVSLTVTTQFSDFEGASEAQETLCDYQEKSKDCVIFVPNTYSWPLNDTGLNCGSTYTRVFFQW